MHSPTHIENNFRSHVRQTPAGSDSDPDRFGQHVVVQAVDSLYVTMATDRPPKKTPRRIDGRACITSHARGCSWRAVPQSTTGTGNYAEISLARAGLTALANQATNVLINGKVPQRQGSNHFPTLLSRRCMTCSDGEVFSAVGSDASIENLV